MEYKIKKYCTQIVEILLKMNESSWVSIFNHFVSQLETTETKELYRDILNVYGGMGSFNDLVLYKDGQPCFKENEHLNKLRKELFNALSNSL